MATCEQCQSQLTPGSNFCSRCGAPVVRESSGDTTRISLPSDSLTYEDLSAEQLSAVVGLAPESAMLIVLHGPDEGARFLIDADSTTAGRHPGSDIFLDDVTVSRHHATFKRREGHLWVEDQMSLNGTYVNRALVDHPVALRRGDEVQIGKFRLVYFTGTSGQS